MSDLLNDRDDVISAENFVILVIEFDFRAAVFGHEHAIAFFDFKRNFLSAVIGFAGAEGDDNAFGGFFLGRIRDDNAAFFDFLLFGRFDKNPVAEGFNV